MKVRTTTEATLSAIESDQLGYRAVHEMTLMAKMIIAAYYAAPDSPIGSGCSTGGRQALTEAQRFPAGLQRNCRRSAHKLSHALAGIEHWKAQAIRKNLGGLIPPSKLPLIHNAVVAACDARDGVKDGLRRIRGYVTSTPKTLECKGEDGPDCLTTAQVAVARAFYSPTVNPRTREQIYPGLMLGGRTRLELRRGSDAWGHDEDPGERVSEIRCIS